MAETLTARVWREQPQRYRLLAYRDTKTGIVYFPPRLVAPGDLKANFEEVSLQEGTGTVVAYTVIRVAPTPHADLAPYALAIIQTEQGVKLTAQVADVDIEEVKIGMKVRFEFRRIFESNEASAIYYGYKAVPV